MSALLSIVLLGVALPVVATIPFAAGHRFNPWLAGFFGAWFLFALVACWPGLPLPPVLGLVCFAGPLLIGSAALFTPWAAGLRRAVAVDWPILWQTARVVGGLFFVPAALGELSWGFAGPAGTGDVLVGVTAPLVAGMYRRQPARGPALGLAWNLLGLLDFAVAIGAAVVTRSQLGFPLQLIPAYFVPVAILMHFFSIGNLLVRPHIADAAGGSAADIGG